MAVIPPATEFGDLCDEIAETIFSFAPLESLATGDRFQIMAAVDCQSPAAPPARHGLRSRSPPLVHRRRRNLSKIRLLEAALPPQRRALHRRLLRPEQIPLLDRFMQRVNPLRRLGRQKDLELHRTFPETGDALEFRNEEGDGVRVTVGNSIRSSGFNEDLQILYIHVVVCKKIVGAGLGQQHHLACWIWDWLWSLKKICWEFLVAGSEQGIEAGQVGLRLIIKGDRQTTVSKEWSVGASNIVDGRWHIVTLTVDGNFDGYQTGLPLHTGSCVWEQGTEVWVGIRPPIDLDAFGRSDSEAADSKMQIMDVFLWGRCLTEDEIATLPGAIVTAEYNMINLLDDNFQWTDSPTRVDDWESDPADVVDWDGQYSSGRRRRSERDGVVVLDVDLFTRRLRKPSLETQEEMNQRMRSVEMAVKEALLARGESQFTDQEFPPGDRSLFVDPDNPPPKLQVVAAWMRPIEIVEENQLVSGPCLFSGAANSSDVCKGRLGDCWFLSAVAVLTEVSRISEVIITPEYNEEGIYTGERVPVVIDDWIPCESPGKPAFATSRKKNELWVSILEKAYAKLHGSYEALEGGLVQDALVDVTGGAGEEIDMRSTEAQIDLASGRLWSQVLRFNQEGFLLGAGSPSGSDVHISSSGIVQGHAYSVLQVREVDGYKLVQIRNPWANEVEWNGPWSDSSPEWTDRMKHKLKHVPQAKDGIFWMSWQDKAFVGASVGYFPFLFLLAGRALSIVGKTSAIEGWRVVASLKIYPPFAGAAVSADTLVVAFGFAVSRPCLTLETRNALSGTYSAPQRSASSAALLVGDPAVIRDKGGNFVLPRADVMKLRDRLRNEELAAGSLMSRLRNNTLRHEAITDIGHKREMCAHARILALEEAIDTEWVYMWDKFGGYLLLLLGLTSKAERVQLYNGERDGRRNIDAETRRGRKGGKERRRALLEKEEHKWKEIEASLMSSIPNAANREAEAVAAAVRAVGGDSGFDDSFARERVSSIARRIRAGQLSQRALQTRLSGAVFILDDEPTTSGRHCGPVDLSVCCGNRVSVSIAVMVQLDSGPVCLLGSELQKKICWEFLVAGSEQGIEAGQVGLRLITKGDRQTTVSKEWSVGASNIADGRWHIVTLTVDADLGEVSCYLDGNFDGYQTGLPLHTGSCVWGARNRGLGGCLTEDEIATLPGAIVTAEYNMINLLDDNFQWTDSPTRVDDWESDLQMLTFMTEMMWIGTDSIQVGGEGDLNGMVLLYWMLIHLREVEMAVKEALLARGESQFTDQEFPPGDRSLFVDPDNPPSKLQVVAAWMRPIEIVEENQLVSGPCLFSGAANSSDVCKGRLGDCWFLSAVAVLTEVSRILEVIITPEYNEEGIYTVRFCIQGEWVPVVIDDCIPCESPGKPAFATSRKKNELWVSILEKAYAKLHGSYEALEGGLVQDALVDVTGGAGEEIDMRSTEAQIVLASGRLWSQVLRFNQEGFLLGAGSPSGSDVHISSSGIVQGHAYSVLQVQEVDGYKLVQIRNPWANEVEWNGPWSDSSPEWTDTDRMKHKLKHVSQAHYTNFNLGPDHQIEPNLQSKQRKKKADHCFVCTFSFPFYFLSTEILKLDGGNTHCARLCEGGCSLLCGGLYLDDGDSRSAWRFSFSNQRRQSEDDGDSSTRRGSSTQRRRRQVSQSDSPSAAQTCARLSAAASSISDPDGCQGGSNARIGTAATVVTSTQSFNARDSLDVQVQFKSSSVYSDSLEGATFLLVLLLLVLAIGAIHYWASHNFYLTRVQMLVVCFLAFLVALVAFLVGWFQDKAFVGASVGYFSFLFLLAGRALSTRNALSGTYSAPQRSASSAALLVGDPAVIRDKGGNFVLPRADVMKLRDRLRNEELAAGSLMSRLRNKTLRHEAITDIGHKREMCAHARILALEEAIDTEWVYMWDKFGGSLLLLLGLTSKAERVQVRLRLFLDSIGLPDLSAKDIKKWLPEEHRRFELIQESYIMEKEMEEEILMQRREEEGRGKERRRALLEKEERKWEEIEASLMSSIPNAGNREAAAVAVAVRAVGGDSVFDDSFARERVSSIARRIRAGQLSQRALQTGLSGAVFILDDEPTTSGRHCGPVDLSVFCSNRVSVSIAVMVQLDSGPVCLLGSELQKKICWEFLVAGSEQGIEAGQIGLRLITKGDRQTTVSKEWSGRLGDCWFLSAVAVLTEVSRISEVIITPEYNEEGIYTVRFCIQGEWVPVVIDDWIPCESPGKPAFATSRKKNELWVSILEKAYAKLHGSYEALEGGLVQDALVDVTGGAGEEIDMRSTEAQIDLASGRLWSQVLRFNQEGFLLGARGGHGTVPVWFRFRNRRFRYRHPISPEPSPCRTVPVPVPGPAVPVLDRPLVGKHEKK
ncbi:unnamed protein product [Cuscuta campestris]|uniref:Calpain catalytic domain-containing protein n=1 Tax=Cuscuta campestris TaxID=132261 RepID=A0A484MAR4_9ASTE|nr:unnamed protein product [Cuscuta campestris]